jgi:dihydroflavonol-4-reductase
VKVFITGGTGFIGKHLVRRLAREGHELRCLVRDPARAAAILPPEARLIQGDVNDAEILREGIRGCDWLIHLANLYSMWEIRPERFEQVNVAGTRCVLEAALDARVKKVVYLSTVAVFGKPDTVPFNETCQPGRRLFSAYARSKAAGNEIAWELYRKRGLPLVVLYPGIVLGADDNKPSGQYIQDIVQQRVPSTIFHHSWATYVYVGDLVEAIIRAAQKPETVGQKYLLGGKSVDGAEYARLISQVSGAALPLFQFPDFMVTAAAYLLTGLSALIRRPPLWGLSIDAAQTLKQGFLFDGSKAARELGIRYQPVHYALCEAVASYHIPKRTGLWGAFLRIFHQEVDHRGGNQPGYCGELESRAVTARIGQPSAD